MLVLRSGKLKPIESIVVKYFDERITVYNFKVADFHTYYVTKDAVLVHNANCGTKNSSNPKYGIKNDENQSAVIKIAKEYKNGIKKLDADTLLEWANEYGIPARIDSGHQGRGIISQGPHMHVGKTGHIPIFPD